MCVRGPDAADIKSMAAAVMIVTEPLYCSGFGRLIKLNVGGGGAAAAAAAAVASGDARCLIYQMLRVTTAAAAAAAAFHDYLQSLSAKCTD